MGNNIQLDYNRMFEHGCAFVDCAKSCQREPNNIEYRFHSHTVAGIVNSAFACEVFIKALLVYHGLSQKEIRKVGHDLNVLWKKYKKKDKSTALLIEQGIKRWFDSEDENLFNEMLKISSNAFEYWRYIYEQKAGSLNINFLIGFRDMLREVCCEKFNGKTWEEYINS